MTGPAPASTWWCAHAWLGGDRMADGVVVSVADGAIAGIEAGVASPPSGARVLAGAVIPGLVNAHSHAFHRALRGHTQAGRGSFWTWREQAYRVAASLTPETYRDLARAAFAEMALAGITTVGEFHYLHHDPGGTAYADPNEMSHALVGAAADAGIRMTLLDTLYLAGGIGQPVAGVQERFSDGSVMAWAARVGVLRDADLLRHGYAMHSVRAVPREALRDAAGYVARRGRPVHAHVSEQPRENTDCLAAHGVTPVELLHDAGLLTGDFTAVHATHLADRDVSLLAGAQAGVCLCPTTERDLADGIGPAPALAAAGVPLSLGSDSHAVIDLIEEARAVELDERLASGERGSFAAADLLRAATGHGAAALGWPSGGLAVGAPADFVELGLGSVRLAGWTPDSLVEAVVFAAAASDVRTTVVAGRAVVEDGRHVGIDVAAELRDSIAAVRVPA